jgi:hypothetical protein
MVLNNNQLEYFNPDVDSDQSQFKDDLDTIARIYSKEVLEVIEPLIDLDLLASPVPTYTGVMKEQRAGPSLVDLQFELIDLIKKAATLHVCVIMSGENGMIINYVPHVQRGTLLSQYDSNHNICLNHDMLEREIRNVPKDKLIIRMTCFPRVEAVIPTGPDQLEMKLQPRRIIPNLPAEMQTSPRAIAWTKKQKSKPGTEWATILTNGDNDHKIHQRITCAETPEYDDLDPSVPGDLRRHAYVTVYPRVAPHNFYCSWDDLIQVTHPTLQEVIVQAQKEKRFESTIDRLWTTISSCMVQGSIMTGLLTAGVAYWLYINRYTWKDARIAFKDVWNRFVQEEQAHLSALPPSAESIATEVALPKMSSIVSAVSVAAGLSSTIVNSISAAPTVYDTVSGTAYMEDGPDADRTYNRVTALSC